LTFEEGRPGGDKKGPGATMFPDLSFFLWFAVLLDFAYF